MKILSINILCLFLLLSLPQPGRSGKQEMVQDDWKLNQIQQAPSGFMQRSGRDPYIIFPQMEATSYDISGVVIEIGFDPMPDKPFLMELFWRPDYEGFSELRKVFFALLPEKNGDTIKFFVPLNNQSGYRQFRLDFPRDIGTSFQVKRFEAVTDQQLAEDVKRIEPFYKLTVTETRTPGVIIPYILHGIQHGLSRLLKDPAFLVVWLLLIFGALIGIRIISRDLRKQDGEKAVDQGE
jgi:hypothetical protein